MILELTTHRRRRAARIRRSAVRWASGLLVATALTFVLPAAFGLSSHTVTDDAMRGTMSKGSAVITDSVPVSDLEVGDVIIFPSPAAESSAPITRRIAEIDRGSVRTSGDRTGALDPWALILAHSTQDRAVAHVPYAGYALDILDGAVRSLFAGFLVLVIAAVSLAGLRSARRDQRAVTSTFARTVETDSTGVPGSEAGVVRLPAPRRKEDARRRSAV